MDGIAGLSCYRRAGRPHRHQRCCRADEIGLLLSRLNMTRDPCRATVRHGCCHARFPSLEAGAVPCRDPFMRPWVSRTATPCRQSFFSRPFVGSMRPNFRATSSSKSVTMFPVAALICGWPICLSGRQPLRSVLPVESIHRATTTTTP